MRKIIHDYYVRPKKEQRRRYARKDYDFMGRIIIIDDPPRDMLRDSVFFEGVFFSEHFLEEEQFEEEMLSLENAGLHRLTKKVKKIWLMKKGEIILVETGQVFASIEKCSEALQIPCNEIADAIATGNEIQKVHFKYV